MFWKERNAVIYFCIQKVDDTLVITNIHHNLGLPRMGFFPYIHIFNWLQRECIDVIRRKKSFKYTKTKEHIKNINMTQLVML